MKTLIWALFSVLAVGWSGLCWLGAAALRWTAGLLAGGDVSALEKVLAEWPVPEWLALWVDLDVLQAARDLIVSILTRLQASWPGAEAALGWLIPMLWLLWGGGLLLLFGLTMLALWLTRPDPPRPAQPQFTG